MATNIYPALSQTWTATSIPISLTLSSVVFSLKCLQQNLSCTVESEPEN